jgi:hypothetical protein
MQRRMNYAPRTDEKAGQNTTELDESEHYAGRYRYRNLKQMWLDNFPRMHGIIFRILVPLWALCAIAIGLGHVLAALEGPNEYVSNDAAMANKFRLLQFPFEDTMNVLLVLPSTCFEIFAMQKLNQTNVTLSPGATEVLSWIENDLPMVTPLNSSSDVDVEYLFGEVDDFLGSCESVSKSIVNQLLDHTDAEAAFEAAAGSSLSFNWIRCWDTELYGKDRFVMAVFETRLIVV